MVVEQREREEENRIPDFRRCERIRWLKPPELDGFVTPFTHGK